MRKSSYYLKISVFLFVLIASSVIALAQGSITGSVRDAQKNPLALSTVTLVAAGDSFKVMAMKADLMGNFKFSNVSDGNYQVEITMVGFKKKVSDSIVVDSLHRSIELESLYVDVEAKEMAQVLVVAKKNLIEQRIDRTVVNVENSILAGGSTALEILEKAPGVVVDHQSDQIKLNNKNGVLVMIDGKKTFLSSADLANMLRGMSSDQIATIEIITNPSAKYDASGNAGIIDIKLKKSKYYGTNGAVSVNTGDGFVPYGPSDLFRESVNLRLNNRTEKLNVYGNLYQNRNADYSQTALGRNITFGNTYSTLNQLIMSPRVNTGFSAKLGLDYAVSAKTTLGFLVDGNTANDKIKGISNTSTRTLSGSKDSSDLVKQNSTIAAPRHNLTANFNIKHDYNKPGKSISFDLTYSDFKNNRNQDFNTDYYDANGNFASNSKQRNFTLSNINIFTTRADLTLPFENNLFFETGLKHDYVRTQNEYTFEKLAFGSWENDPGKSNTFIYSENVSAAYVNLNKKWDKWTLQGGLRAEQTFTNGNSITTGKVVNRSYISFFPSIFVSQKVNDDNALRYSYSRRIDRPNYQQLNPFIFFEDPYTLDEGNPFLKPQFSDNFEISYTYKGKATLSLGYSNTRDYIVQITKQDDTTRVITAIDGNLGSFKNYSANLSFPVSISKWWNMQNQVNLYYNKFSDNELLGGQFYSGKLAYNINVYNTFRLSDKWSAELGFGYVSPYVYGLERTIKPRYRIDAGVQKTFAKNRAKLKFNFSDIFLNQQYTGVLKYQNIDLSILNKWTSRRASLTFSYNFGKQSIKSSRERSTGAEDLKNRVITKE